MKDVKYNLDLSVLPEILEKLKSDEEYGCSNLGDRPVTTVYPEFLYQGADKTEQHTHTPQHNKTDT